MKSQQNLILNANLETKMTAIHDSTLTSFGLSTTAPGTVTATNGSITQAGFTIDTPVILGTAGSDTIASSPSALYVFGYGGNDTLNSNGQAAALLGGSGSDTFVMTNIAASAVPDGNILDFEVGADTIDLTDFSLNGFSDLNITLNTEGVTGSFASITNGTAV
jgi:hypothetical protein